MIREWITANAEELRNAPHREALYSKFKTQFPNASGKSFTDFKRILLEININYDEVPKRVTSIEDSKLNIK